MNKTKRYRLSQDMYKIIQNANGGLFLLYTRHNPGDVLNLLLVDITFEFALNDTELLQHEYVVFGEYDLQTINRVTKETGYYGDIYRNVYIERVKDNPRRNEVTPGVGTQ